MKKHAVRESSASMDVRMQAEAFRVWVAAALLAFAPHVVAQAQGLPPGMRIIDPKEERKKDPFMILHDRPLSESAAIIPGLIANANVQPPQYQYELARRLWQTDKAAAFEWYAVGMARARYDALRCVDPTARQGIQVLPSIAPEVSSGIESDRKAFGEAGLRALARRDLFVDAISPAWICMHGMAAMNAALRGRQLAQSDWLRPPSDWEGIRAEVRADLNKYFVAQGESQDDPVPMTQAKLPRFTLPAGVGAPYAWLDADRLAAGTIEKDSEGKPVRRLTAFTVEGRREDLATLASPGIWCAGSGVLSYQTGHELLPDRTQRITLAIGPPGKTESRTLELRAPLLNSFGAQGFSQSWSLPSNATRQSPFDCRWETNAALSGPKNADQWLPLLPGHGFVHFQRDQGSARALWVGPEGESIELPVDASRLTLESFRQLAWQDAYFVSPVWSRFSHKEKSLPACVPAAYIRPKERRVEATCAPFDTGNTANAVMFSPSRAGWLRATSARNTAHGAKTGGLYLVRSDGKTEKLFDTHVDSWSVSPDGCRVALYHRPGGGAIAGNAIDILDLCRP